MTFLSLIMGVWHWRWEVMLPLLLLLALYGRGWLHLHRLHARTVARRHPYRRRQVDEKVQIATWRRLAAYLSGWLLVVVALISGVDAYGAMFFFVHMIQHLLLLMLAPPLLWLGNPFPIALWGLPRAVRLTLGHWLAPEGWLARLLAAVARPGWAWLAVVVVTWVWHDSKLYDAALRHEIVHDLEHISFFLVGLYFWWLVIGAAPRTYTFTSPLRRSLYLLAATPPNMLLGVAIAFASAPLYSYYTSIPRLWGMSVMQDQRLGGFIMWIPGSMMYLMAALIAAAAFFSNEERKQSLAPAHWGETGVLRLPSSENKKSKHQ